MRKKFSAEIEIFIRRYVRDLNEGVAAVFAGAGLSRDSGYVNWPELMREVAEELGLSVDKEHDLVSLAQFHVNERSGSGGLARRIIDEFSEHAEPSQSHQILARLPIRTYWTTNYDQLIEGTLRKNQRVPDVKHQVSDLLTTRPKRDAVVYKMHGDALSPNQAILHKSQYEQYYKTHEAFVTALSGDLISKTFLFIGFSFTDPNLDYVLSRLHVPPHARREHYCFLRREPSTPYEKEDAEAVRYRRRKQELHIQDLKRFGIQTLLVEEYDDIPKILRAIEEQFLKKTIFIAGSAEEYGDWEKNDALNFIHTLSSSLVRAGYRVVNGFGWGVGSAVINGALDAIYSNPEKYSEDQLVMRPFPQVASQGQDLGVLWQQYRERMISLSGIALFVFGNKVGQNGIENAGGVQKEFDIAVAQGVVPVPIGATGYMAKELAEKVIADPGTYVPEDLWLADELKKLNDRSTGAKAIEDTVLRIVKKLEGA
ncbi:SIR2 family protein [Pseudomonas atacamensis]|uniref:SIR2 family protein n=1 Tax=Pseudomonas atacamensis TaxID=2565368 RepID=UPI001FAD96D9|nr:SIR2 family protein [Pseudomonas atacamensis]MCI9876947.1 SIR2 family protein [Pseudomonas atacamensis]